MFADFIQLLSQTCNIINGAVHQSGAPVFGMSNQESNYANKAIQRHIRAANLEVLPSPDENVEGLPSFSLKLNHLFSKFSSSFCRSSGYNI